MTNYVGVELEKIAMTLAEAFIELPQVAVLGIDAYKALQTYYGQNVRYTVGSGPSNGMVKIQHMNLSLGTVEIKCDPRIPKDHISIGHYTSKTARIMATMRRLDLHNSVL